MDSNLNNKVVIDYTYAKQGKCGQSYGEVCAITELLTRMQMTYDHNEIIVHCPTERIRNIIIGYNDAPITYIVDNYEFTQGDNTTTIRLFPEKSLEATYDNIGDAHDAIMTELYSDLQDAFVMMNQRSVCMLEICAPSGEMALAIMEEVINSTLLDGTDIALLGTVVNYDIKIVNNKQ